ncbi:hypothetical protein HMPREF0880_04261 [Yokenella regensburgei ATCC 43003]|nr:hypothetical protein HMPREF0880_04261 [Yokenella regensburgei ATCC 43003]
MNIKKNLIITCTLLIKHVYDVLSVTVGGILMHASDYLRLKFQSDRQLSLYTQSGVVNTMQTAKGVASDIYSGIERVSWYASCFVPKYSDVCQELKSEEIRTIYSIMSIFRYHDVISHILYLYFQSVCNDVKEGNQGGSARTIVRQVAGISANRVAEGATRYAMASAIAEIIAKSEFLSKAVAQKLACKTPTGVYLFQIYGIQQKIAMAARALKAKSPDYYWILYQAKLEMLYYFVEPLLSEIIQKVNTGSFSNLDQLVDYIKETYNV